MKIIWRYKRKKDRQPNFALIRNNQSFGAWWCAWVGMLIAIPTIFTMIFISLQPFAVKRVFLLIAAIVCLLTASCFADSVFLTVGSSPYDRQMGRIRPVLRSLKSNGSANRISLALINHWIADPRGISYGFSQEWNTPPEVEAGLANPTINWTTYKTDQFGTQAYIPLYAYSGGHEYRAIASVLYAKN